MLGSVNVHDEIVFWKDVDTVPSVGKFEQGWCRQGLEWNSPFSRDWQWSENAEGSRNPWVIKFYGMLVCRPVASWPRIFLQKGVVLAPCTNFATTHSDSFHSEFLSPFDFATHKTEDPFATPQIREKQRVGKTQGRGKHTIKPLPKNSFGPPHLWYVFPPPPLFTPCNFP